MQFDQERTVDVFTNKRFDQLYIKREVLFNLKKAGFVKPTPVQVSALPIGLINNDILVQAKSGTGKTLVFAVMAVTAVYERGESELHNPTAMIVAPTREIAVQIKEVIDSIKLPDQLVRLCIGGTDVRASKVDLINGADIVIGTPGRLASTLQNNVCDFSTLRLFVLDEADKLMDPLYAADIRMLYTAVHRNTQIGVFSATYPTLLENDLKELMKKPYFIRLNQEDVQPVGIKEYAVVCTDDSVVGAINDLLARIEYVQGVIFVNHIPLCHAICNRLKRSGHVADAISSNLEQMERTQIMSDFKKGKYRILVATDLIARGVDIPSVDIVINVGVPKEKETYQHRIGRAGRHGRLGAALTVLLSPEEITEFAALIQGNLRPVKKLQVTDDFPYDLPLNALFFESCPDFVVDETLVNESYYQYNSAASVPTFATRQQLGSICSTSITCAPTPTTTRRDGTTPTMSLPIRDVTGVKMVQYTSGELFAIFHDGNFAEETEKFSLIIKKQAFGKDFDLRPFSSLTTYVNAVEAKAKVVEQKLAQRNAGGTPESAVPSIDVIQKLAENRKTLQAKSFGSSAQFGGGSLFSKTSKSPDQSGVCQVASESNVGNSTKPSLASNLENLKAKSFGKSFGGSDRSMGSLSSMFNSSGKPRVVEDNREVIALKSRFKKMSTAENSRTPSPSPSQAPNGASKAAPELPKVASPEKVVVEKVDVDPEVIEESDYNYTVKEMNKIFTDKPRKFWFDYAKKKAGSWPLADFPFNDNLGPGSSVEAVPQEPPPRPPATNEQRQASERRREDYTRQVRDHQEKRYARELAAASSVPYGVVGFGAGDSSRKHASQYSEWSQFTRKVDVDVQIAKSSEPGKKFGPMVFPRAAGTLADECLSRVREALCRMSSTRSTLRDAATQAVMTGNSTEISVPTNSSVTGSLATSDPTDLATPSNLGPEVEEADLPDDSLLEEEEETMDSNDVLSTTLPAESMRSPPFTMAKTGDQALDFYGTYISLYLKNMSCLK